MESSQVPLLARGLSEKFREYGRSIEMQKDFSIQILRLYPSSMDLIRHRIEIENSILDGFCDFNPHYKTVLTTHKRSLYSNKNCSERMCKPEEKSEYKALINRVKYEFRKLISKVYEEVESEIIDEGISLALDQSEHHDDIYGHNSMIHPVITDIKKPNSILNPVKTIKSQQNKKNIKRKNNDNITSQLKLIQKEIEILKKEIEEDDDITLNLNNRVGIRKGKSVVQFNNPQQFIRRNQNEKDEIFYPYDGVEADKHVSDLKLKGYTVFENIFTTAILDPLVLTLDEYNKFLILSSRIFKDSGRMAVHQDKFKQFIHREEFYISLKKIIDYIETYVVKGSSNIEPVIIVSNGGEKSQTLHRDYISNKKERNEHENNMNFSVMIPLSDTLLYHLWFQDGGSVEVKRGNFVLFEGWCKHRGMHLNGIHCRLFFYVTGYLSWQIKGNNIAATSHLHDNKCVIDKSEIDNAGFGVFANKTIQEGDVITFYEHANVSKIQFCESASNKRLYIDGNYCVGLEIKDIDKQGYGSIINRGTSATNNCKFFYNRSLRVIYIKALCTIQSGTELLMSYGKGYKMSLNTGKGVREIIIPDDDDEDHIDPDDDGDEHLSQKVRVE
jgi:hypothetical protein